jgi:alkylation response protein AidB-like acyl-CoA dehydrogenase
MNRALDWLAALRPSLGGDRVLWAAWEALAGDLAQKVSAPPAAEHRIDRSRRLLELRREFAHHRAPAGADAALWQFGAQFLTGYVDLDLRDLIGAGHGRMVLDYARAPLAATWSRRLAAGDLVGIAATEAHGGSRIAEITTAAIERNGRWHLKGEKCWVSRLVESSAFVVFVRDPAGSVSAVLVDADSPRLRRAILEPAGLRGWTWGRLHFDGVVVDPQTRLLGGPGDGLAVFRTHFTRFRPQVTACALGAAAGVCDQVRSTLADKRRTGVLPRIRDNALIAIGMSWAEICSALLLAAHAARHPTLDLASRAGKAHGVDAACRSVARLAPLIGAAGFQREHPVMRAQLNLAALRFADGIHDSLYRSGGKELIRDGRGETASGGD